MAARFRLLHRPIECKPASVDHFVKAICCLHNFLIDEQGVPSVAAAEAAAEESGVLTRAAMRRRNANRAPNDAEEMRRVLVDYFSAEGTVDWQEDYA